MFEQLRAWAAKHADEGRYSPVGIAFHWIMAVLILFQLGYGFYSGFLAPGGNKLHTYHVHSAVGLTILVLTFLRAGWRIMIPGPVNDADRLGWQTTIAKVTHVLFYLSFLALPLSGWVMWSAFAPPGPLYLAGVMPWPQVPLDGLTLELRLAILGSAESVHQVFIVLLLVLIPAHVGAALKHHFWDHHDVLEGMLPEVPDWEDPRPAPPHRPREPRFRLE